MRRRHGRFLEAAGDYTLNLREVADLGGDRVLAVIEGGLTGRRTGERRPSA